MHTHSNKLQSHEQKKQVFFYDHTIDFIDFVKEAAQHSDSTLFWILDFNNDHSNFDMEWRPELWESNDTHIFSNQYQKFSYTMLVNKNTILKNITNITSIDNLPNAHYRDDIILQNQMHIPVNKNIRVDLSSKDVIHNFKLPELRVSQDAIPGMTIPVHFTATMTSDDFLKTVVGTPREGKGLEIACAQLCGITHYRMRGYLTVDTEEQYNDWLASEAEYLDFGDDEDEWGDDEDW